MSDTRLSKYRACRLGFTLLELTIASAILLIISALSAGMLIYGLRGLRDARTKSESDYEFSRAYALMKRQIASAYRPASGTTPFRLDKSGDGKSDGIYFFTESPEKGRGAVTAGYFILDENGRKRLGYGELPYPMELSDENVQALRKRGGILSERISSMSVSVKGDGKGDGKGGVPDEITITLTASRNGEEESSFTLTARPGIKWR